MECNIKAKDYTGKDISNKIKVYGNIDLKKKGIYKLKSVVKSDNGLACTKYINVIVE